VASTILAVVDLVNSDPRGGNQAEVRRISSQAREDRPMTLDDLFQQAKQGVITTIGFQIDIAGTPFYSGALTYEEVTPELSKFSGLSLPHAVYGQTLFQIFRQPLPANVEPKRGGSFGSYHAEYTPPGEAPPGVAGFVPVVTSDSSTRGVAFHNPAGDVKVLLQN
jgi:hypothetical protein